MAIVGVGIDVVDIARFEAAMRRTPGLGPRLFTPSEIDRPPASLAARFAAKEALAKALGAPEGMAWHDAEVISHPSGRPLFAISGTVAARSAELGAAHVLLSLPPAAGIASAVVVLES